MSRISLRTDLYMTQEDQVFITNVVVTDPMWEMVALSVISQQQMQLWTLVPLLRSTSIEGFMRGIILFQWPWRCMAHPSVIWIVSSGNVLVFSIVGNLEIIYLCLFTFNFSGIMLILLFSVF
jgi:hypothetical protein